MERKKEIITGLFVGFIVWFMSLIVYLLDNSIVINFGGMEFQGAKALCVGAFLYPVMSLMIFLSIKTIYCSVFNIEQKND